MRYKLIAAIVVVCFLFGMGVNSSLAAIVLNGSFEEGNYVPNSSGFETLINGNTDITGWTVTGLSIDWIGSYWQAADLSKSLDLAGLGDGGVLQSLLTTIVGQEYRLSFAMAGNTDNGPTVKTMIVTVDGLISIPYTFNTSGHSRGSMGWELHTLDFVAESTTTLLSFSNETGTAYGAALDAVSVDPIPEPATIIIWSLFGLGSMFGLRVWRRRGIAVPATPARHQPWSDESRMAIHQIIEKGCRH
jgi:choice-of-anchor C domain-containing protein